MFFEDKEDLLNKVKELNSDNSTLCIVAEEPVNIGKKWSSRLHVFSPNIENLFPIVTKEFSKNIEETHEIKLKNKVAPEKISQFISFYNQKTGDAEDPYNKQISKLLEKAKVSELVFEEGMLQLHDYFHSFLRDKMLIWIIAEDPQKSKLKVKAQPGYGKKFEAADGRHSIVKLVNMFDE